MRYSSLLVALEAGCLTLAAPTALGFSSRQTRACVPGSIEAQETDYYNRMEAGAANQRKAVEMCMRLTLPAPCPENRPRTPSAVDIVPCDSTPDAPETNQMYFRLTLPDPSIQEGHRTPSIVDPKPFATYSEHHGDGSGASESSSDQRIESTDGDGSHSGGANDGSAHGQGESALKGETSDRSGSQASASGHQGPPSAPSAPSGGNSAGAGSTGSGEGINHQEESGGQSQAGTHDASPSGGSGTAGTPPARNDAGTGDGDSDGTFRSGANHAAHDSSNSPSSPAPTEDDSGALIDLKVHAAAFDEAPSSSSAPTGVEDGPLLSVKVHAAALHQPSGSDTPVSTVGPLLSVKADIAKHSGAGGPATETPVDDVLGSDALIHLAAGVGSLDGQQSSDSNQPSVVDAINDSGKGPLLSGEVHATALQGVGEDSNPGTKALDVVEDQSPNGQVSDATGPMGTPSGSDLPSLGKGNNGHLVNVKATVPVPSQGDMGEPDDVPEPHALLNVKGSTPDRVSNDATTSHTPVEDATHAATLLKLKAAASPPS